MEKQTDKNQNEENNSKASKRLDPNTIAGFLQAILEEEGIEYKLLKPDNDSAAYVFGITYKEKKFVVSAWNHRTVLYALRGWPKRELSNTDNEYLIIRAVNETNKRHPPKIIYDFESNKGIKYLTLWCTLNIFWLPGMPTPGAFLKENLDCMLESQEIFEQISKEQQIGLMPNINVNSSQYKA